LAGGVSGVETGAADPDASLRRLAERRVSARYGFYRHAMIYVMVNAGLAAVNLITSPGYLWFLWALCGWGVGLAAHGLAVFASGGAARENAVTAEIERLRSRRGTTVR
jgi:hypothetical protein